VDNACKYARRDGASTIDLVVTRGSGLELCVRDHGPGIPPGVARRVFQAFERAEPAGAVPGLGLGLAIARGLAQDLGGDLALEAGDGSGACFRLTLPG